MSHNVLAFSGHPKEVNQTDLEIFDRAIAYYKASNVDILILQEGPQESFVKKLADSLQFHYSFFKQSWSGNIQYPFGFPGCVISRFPIFEAEDLNLKRGKIADSIFQRHLGFVELKTPKGMIQVIGLHLCADFGGRFRESTRMKELEILFEKLPDCANCLCTVLAGDFNAVPGSNPYQKVIGHGFTDPHSKANFPTVPIPNPQARIDYLFVKKNAPIIFTVSQVQMPFYNDLKMHLSDHLPCLLKMKLE